MAILETVRQMFGQRKASAATSYRELVEGIAGGKPTPDNAVDIAIAAGRSVNDLERDATLLTQRQEAAAQIQQADGMTTEIETLQQALSAAAAQRTAAEAEAKRIVDEATAAYQAAKHRVRDVENRRTVLRSRAMQVLLKTADPHIDQQIQSLEQQRQQVLYQKNEMGTKLPPRSVTDGMVPVPADAKPETVHELRQAELKRLDALAVELAEQIRELEARKLDPAACAVG